MTFTTLYRKGKQGTVHYCNLWVTGQVIHIDTGNLTYDRIIFNDTKIAANEQEAITNASRLWSTLRTEDWKCAQELGINSNNQSWTPFTSGSLEELLQQLL